MTFEEAHVVFKSWQGYMEIADKLNKIFVLVPESFLPYPVEVLEEALNIVAKRYFDSGDKKAADEIQDSMALHLTGYYLSNENGKLVVTDDKLTDEEVIKKMKHDLDFMLNHPDLMKIKLENLKKITASWRDFHQTAPRCKSCGRVANISDGLKINT